MTDKELIKQEIERLLKENEHHQHNDSIQESLDKASKYRVLYELKKFIDSLPEEPTVKGITWKDVNTLHTLINQVRHEFPNGISEESFGLAVLERFNDYQDDVEEPVSKNLEKEKKNYSERYERIAQTEQFKKSYCGKSLGKEEPVSKDLEEEIEKKWTNCATFVPSVSGESSLLEESGHYELNISKSDFKDIARHFAEWSRKQMMKEAINGIMDCDDDNEWIEITDKLIVTPSKAGKKIKFIVVKED